MSTIKGKDVIRELAERYQRLYLSPFQEDLSSEYEAVALCGAEPKSKSLSHFYCSDMDELSFADTPAGEVLVVTLGDRRDFEMVLNIMANKCKVKEIPATQGASILDGVVNWNKINAHREEFLKEAEEKGIEDPDWNAEFKRFTSDRDNFKEALIILSVGPYSAIAARDAGFAEDKWISLSHTIRMYHECTHFVCRRLYRSKINAIWDELVADAVGIYAALGRFDLRLAQLFLGIREGKYTGGRLENYVDDKASIDELAVKVQGTLGLFDELLSGKSGPGPFDVAIMLEDKYEEFGAGEYL